MHEAKNTQRSLVRIGYDGRVHKLFRGPQAQQRFDNEAAVLNYLADQDCPFVPRVLEQYPDRLELVLSNCGSRVERVSEEKCREIFARLEPYHVRHDDPFDRNITYRSTDGQFCIIDFEFATILSPVEAAVGPSEATEDQPVMPARRRSLDSPGGELFDAQRIAWSAKSHRGRFRSNNEDYYFAAEITDMGLRWLGVSGEASLEAAEWMFGVSDGMGGERSGEFASRATTTVLASQLPRHAQQTDGAQQDLSLSVLRNTTYAIHDMLLKLGEADSHLYNMGATLTLVWLRGRMAYYVHVGDSRLYHMTPAGSLEQLTADDTYAHSLLRSGKINEREFREHPRRSALMQCLGSGHRYLQPQCGSIPMSRGEKLLLCTDGIIDAHTDRSLCEMLLDPPAKYRSVSPAAALVDSSVAIHGRDNSSAVVLELF